MLKNNEWACWEGARKENWTRAGRWWPQALPLTIGVTGRKVASLCLSDLTIRIRVKWTGLYGNFQCKHSLRILSPPPPFPLLPPFPPLALFPLAVPFHSSFPFSLWCVVFIPRPLHRLFYFHYQAICANKCDANKVRQDFGSDWIRIAPLEFF